METKTTLMRYRNEKIIKCEVKWYRSGEKYTLMMTARLNTFDLECSSWGAEDIKIYKLCYKERGNLTYFLIRCASLQEYRQEIMELKRPSEESIEDRLDRLENQ